MQFYLNGYTPGDPLIEDPDPSVSERPGELPEQVDVLIIGCGPAGLVLAAQMSNFPDIKTAVIDRKAGPLQVGQADGVACRTVEMFEAFGLADRLVNEAYWVNEVCFWRPDPEDQTRIKRAGRIRDTEEDLSEFPHVIVNQARMLAYLRDHMERSASRLEPFYGLRADEVEIDTHGSAEYPVTVTLWHLDGRQETGKTSIVRAKYVVGCDGARSAIRPAIGRELVGDATNESWGVMDALAVSDFPDVRVKCVISSANDGNILIIPREGGFLVRFYIELDEVSDREMLESRTVTPEKLAEVANRIMHPYTVQIKHVGWSSVYQIGQRLCDKFDDVPVSEMSRTSAPGLHRGRCVPHPQRQGRPGHERFHGRRLEPWLEARLCAQGDGQAGPPSHLLRGASGGRQATDRLRPRFLQEVPRPPEGIGRCRYRPARPGGVPAALHRGGALHRGRRDPVRPVDDHG